MISHNLLISATTGLETLLARIWLLRAFHPDPKPRLPRDIQFFDDSYNAEPNRILDGIREYDREVQAYYDTRGKDLSERAYSDMTTKKATSTAALEMGFEHARAQGFDLEK